MDEYDNWSDENYKWLLKSLKSDECNRADGSNGMKPIESEE